MSDNRNTFANRRSENTWAAWAVAFDKVGIRTNADGPVTGGTVKRTRYEVRRYYGEPIGEPGLKAEKAKVLKRRKPQRPAARITGLKGVHASPKGLRHGFRVAAATAGEVF